MVMLSRIGFCGAIGSIRREKCDVILLYEHGINNESGLIKNQGSGGGLLCPGPVNVS
jgi:hypothetical protein